MSFNISPSPFYNKGQNKMFDLYMSKFLFDAETKGLTKIDIPDNDFTHWLKEGQMIYWKDCEHSPQTLTKPKYWWKFHKFYLELCKDYKVEIYSNDFTHSEMIGEIDKLGHNLLKIDSFIIKSNGDYGRITNFLIEDSINIDAVRDSILNPHREEIYTKHIEIEFEYESITRIKISENPEFGHKKSMKLDEFVSTWAIIEDLDLVLHHQKIMSIENGDLELQNRLLGDGNQTNQNTDLIGTSSVQQLKNAETQLHVKSNTVCVIQYSMQRSLQLRREEIEKLFQEKKDQLEGLMSDLNRSVEVLNKEIKKIQKLVYTLEIYLGVHENIIQIQEGTPAVADEPIKLMQAVKYMDEEFGDPHNGGLDYNSISEFNDWLIQTKNYKKVAPFEKCVVIMQPRRFKYTISPENRWYNHEANKQVYVLIRNGENIYSIWTKNIEMTDRLFPLRSELQQFMDDYGKLKEDSEKENHDYELRNIEKRMNEIDESIFLYKRNFILLQGVITRTQIFAPIDPNLNVLDVNTHGKNLEFVYDDELKLPDGRMRFSKWVLYNNQNLTKGSRIYLDTPRGDSEDHKSRFTIWWTNKYSAPEMPKSGVYTLKEHIEETFNNKIFEISGAEYLKQKKEEDKKRDAIIDENIKKGRTNNETVHPKYKLVDDRKPIGETVEVYINDEGNWDYVKEKIVKTTLKITYNNGGKTYLSYLIYPNRDTFILNYDSLALDDIDFYISNSVDRQHYLSMLPILWGIRKDLIEEQKQEDNFAMMLESKVKAEDKRFAELNLGGIIKDSIRWWKDEVVKVWKRPITKDNIKALRMIEQEVRRRIRDEFKLKIDTGVDNRKLTQICKIDNETFLIYGCTKLEFQDKIRNTIMGYKYTKAEILRNITVTNNPENCEWAKSEPKTLIKI